MASRKPEDFECKDAVEWEARADVIDRAGPYELLRVHGTVFLCLRDSSTRRHLLRVPPTIRTIAQAISWTVGR